MSKVDVSWCRKGGARGYVTTRPFVWQIGKSGSGWALSIPAGREFESSVPWFLGWFFSPDDPDFLRAAVVHDTLLESGFRKAFADSQWFECAMSEGAPTGRAWLAYWGMVVRRGLRDFWKLN